MTQQRSQILVSAEDQTKPGLDSVRQNLLSMQAAVSEAQTVMRGFLGGQIVSAAGDAAKALVQARVQADQLQAVFKQAAGANAASELAFVAREAARLGLPLQESAKAYGQLAAAAKGTALEGGQARDVFIAVAQAATAMGLSSSETEGALRSVQQMMSKGKVQAEELRGQLGERLPGAFQIAARAMGVSTQALDDMLQKGQIISDDFLPKFAAQLRAETAQAAAEAANGMQAAVNRMQNAWKSFQQEVSKTLVGDVIKDSAERAASGIKVLSDDMKIANENADTFGKKLAVIAALLDPFGRDSMAALANEGRTASAFRDPSRALDVLSGGGRRPSPADVQKADREALDALLNPGGSAFVDWRKLLEAYRSRPEQMADAIAEARRLAGLTGNDPTAVIAAIRDRYSDKKKPHYDHEALTAEQQGVIDAVKATTQATDAAKAYAIALQTVDGLFFDGKISAVQYDLAVRELSKSQETAGKDGVGELDKLASKWIDTIEPLRKYQRALEEIEKLTTFGKLSPEQSALLRYQLGNEMDAFGQITPKVEEAKRSMQSFGQIATSAFEDAAFSAKGFGEIAQGAVQDLLKALGRAQLLNPASEALNAWVSGAMGGKTWFESLTGIKPAARAGGGDVSAGTPYMVGEVGPELFVPKASGTIIPSGRFGGSSVHITMPQTINVGDGASRSEVIAAMATARDAAIAAIYQSMNRWGSFGRMAG